MHRNRSDVLRGPRDQRSAKRPIAASTSARSWTVKVTPLALALSSTCSGFVAPMMALAANSRS
jgi:hypothetical protein